MSLQPYPVPAVPELTARAAFPKGNPYLRLRDGDFVGLFPRRGQPALPPWRLALVTVMQFAEELSDRQAADAVRARIDGKYALGLELDDPGFNFSVLCEFRARLAAGGSERLLLAHERRLGWIVGYPPGRTLYRSPLMSHAPYPALYQEL